MISSTTQAPSHNGLLVGDCRTTLPTLPEGTFHMVVTSPPYFRLRAYDGDEDGVEWPEVRYRPMRDLPEVVVPAGRTALGQEEEVTHYVGHLVEVMREVRRVLRPDGVLWLNLGDTYTSGSRDKHYEDQKSAGRKGGRPQGPQSGDLIGVPWRVALALQADGWVLRTDVVWAKRNMIPESVTGWRWEQCRVKVRAGRRGQQVYGARSSPGRPQSDWSHDVNLSAPEWAPCPGCDKCRANGGLVLRRGSWRPTRSHEAVLMLTRSERYFSDGESVREPHNLQYVQRRKSLSGDKSQTGRMDRRPVMSMRYDGVPLGNPDGRNQRDVWFLASYPSKIRHFAMMPPLLVERCLLSGPEHVCAACGTPWVRIVDRQTYREASGERPMDKTQCNVVRAGWRQGGPTRTTRGHRPACACGVGSVPPRVLDPFVGAGTVAGVAEVLGWCWTGCELSPNYAEIVPQRIAEVRTALRPTRDKRTPRKEPQAASPLRQLGFVV